MLALTHLLLGLAIAHVTLAIFFVIGSVAFPWCEQQDTSATPARRMLRVTCTCALGAAVVGLALFVAGTLGGFSRLGVGVTILAVFAIACACRRTSPFRAAFWLSRVDAFRRSWTWPALLVYAAMLAIATRAVVPEGTGYSDAIYYHFAYAQDWANAGRLVVDPFMAFIFYANNFVLFFTTWIVLGAGGFMQFLTWSAGLVMALALYAGIQDCGGDAEGRPWCTGIGLLAVASVVLAPIFIDYSVLGYIDVPIGAFALLSVISLQLAMRERRISWLAASAVIAGFLIGMKASFIVLAPVFAFALVWAGLAIGERRSSIGGIVLTLCVVAAPWYLRNFVLAGDPIAPTLNIALHGKDGLWTAAEWSYLWNDMATAKSPRAFLTLPVRAYLKPGSLDFREYGACALMLFLYVPAAAAIVLLALRRKLEPEVAIPIFVMSILALYWFVTTSLLRYALLFYPLLALCVGMLLVEMGRRRTQLKPLALGFAIVAALPPFSSLAPDGDFIQNDVLSELHDFLHYRGEQAFLRQNDDGYSDEELASAWMRRHGYSGNVYVISDNAFDYYFRRNGVLSIGNWIGPAGYFRLLQAIDAGEAVEFLDDLGTRGVFLSPQQMLDAGIERVLAEQLTHAGYHQIPLTPGSRYHFYVRD